MSFLESEGPVFDFENCHFVFFKCEFRILKGCPAKASSA